MPNLDDVFASMSNDVENQICLIDENTREINIPSTLSVIGVESDEAVERLYFEINKIIGNNVDVSSMGLRINYMNAQGEKDQYIVTDMNVENDKVKFSWLLSRKATKYKGKITFIVCLVKTLENGEITNEWNTTINNQLNVLQGLEIEESVKEPILSDLKSQLEYLMSEMVDNAKVEVKEYAESDIENIANEVVPPIAKKEVDDYAKETFTPTVQQMVSDAIAKVIDGAPESFDTLKEISDWITSHSDDAASMNAEIKENARNIKSLDGRTKTNEDDISSLKTKTDTTDENVTNNKNSIDGLTTRMDSVEEKATSNEGRISDLEDENQNIKDKIDEITLTTTTTSPYLRLTDSVDGKAELSGIVKNVIQYPFTDTTFTREGITFTDNKDGTITINGTATAVTGFIIATNKTYESGVYTFSGFPQGITDVNTYWYTDYNGRRNSDNGNGCTINISKNTPISFSVRIARGVTFNNAIFKPMLELGTTAHPYVPYNYDIKSCGKNLAGDLNTKRTDGYSSNVNVVENKNTVRIVQTGKSYAYAEFKFKLKKDKTYNLKFDYVFKNANFKGLYLFYDQADYYGYSISKQDDAGSVSKQFTANKDYIYLRVYPSNTSENGECTITNMMLSESATPYEPYQGDTVTIDQTTEKVYINTFDGETNIFTDYGVPITATYGVTDTGADIFESQARSIANETYISNTFFDNAGSHNGIFRGKYLGTSVTDEQWANIANGTFKDLYIGDYWTIGGQNYRIADFNTFLHCGNEDFGDNHIVVLPDDCLINADGSTTKLMKDTNSTEGGYYGTKWISTYRTQCVNIASNAFGSSHLASHSELICNAVSGGKSNSWAWVISPGVELPTEINIFGANVWGDGGYNIGINKTQFALCRLYPQIIAKCSIDWWLRDVCSTSEYACVHDKGFANSLKASNAYGCFRPYIVLKG